MKFELSKEWWRTYAVLGVFAFLIMAMFFYAAIQQRNDYAELYFNEPILQESNWDCSMKFHFDKPIPVGDVNVIVDEFVMSMPCNEAMSYNFLNGMKR